MKALVTGAEGFVGPYLIKELQKEDEVVGTYRPKHKPTLPITMHAMDVLDTEQIAKVFEEETPDIIYHLAAVNDTRLGNQDPELTWKVNVEGTRNILDAAQKIGAKVVLIGSAQEYGVPQTVPITEEHPLQPISPYGKTKVEAEQIALEYDMPVFFLRSFNHIGPGQSEDFVTSAFAKQIAEIEQGKRDVLRVGNLEAKRDFTDVRDVARAYAMVPEAVPGVPYNICSGVSYSIQEVLDMLIELSDADVTVEKDTKRLKKSDIPVLEGSREKYTEATGWEPRIPIKESLKDILDYWRSV